MSGEVDGERSVLATLGIIVDSSKHVFHEKIVSLLCIHSFMHLS